ncbi:hypothetical protein SESBI_21619 [Sesbania bispinosa]|nr:hypothetical protein SESBI_21619 [Sesbania bispinosa]
MLPVAEIRCNRSFTLARTGSTLSVSTRCSNTWLPVVTSRQSQSRSAWRRRSVAIVFTLRKIGV